MASIIAAITGLSASSQVGSVVVYTSSVNFVPEQPATEFLFRPVISRLAARYAGATVVEMQDGRASFVAPWNSINITPDITDQWIQIQAGMEGRLDIVAQQVYNRSDLWWCLAQANNILNPFEQPRAGDTIRIPTISRVSRILGRVSTGNELSRFRV